MGIEQEQVKEGSSNLFAYPNPAQNSLQVKVADNSKIQAINLYDVLGKEVIKNDELKMQNGAAQIDISNLSEGVYFIKVKTTESFYSKKIIVQH